MLSCYWNRRRIGAYLDGALPDKTARATAGHLEACARCREEADGLRRLRGLLRRTSAVAEPADWTSFWPGVLRGIEDARRSPRPEGAGRIAWQPRLAWGGALAAVLLVSLTFWQLSHGPSPAAPDGRVFVSSASTDDPRASVMVYSTPEQDVAVVWLLGVD